MHLDARNRVVFGGITCPSRDFEASRSLGVLSAQYVLYAMPSARYTVHPTTALPYPSEASSMDHPMVPSRSSLTAGHGSVPAECT